MKNPNDPIWAKDRALALYRSIMKRYLPSGKPTDVYNWYGMTVAWSMVDALRRAGKAPTRAALLEAARSIDIRLRTSSRDYFPIDTVYLYRYDNKQWVRASALLPIR